MLATESDKNLLFKTWPRTFDPGLWWPRTCDPGLGCRKTASPVWWGGADERSDR